MVLSFFVLEKLKFFCGKTAFSLSFPLYYIASYVLTASAYENHLLSYLPLLKSYIYKSSSPAFFHSFQSFRSSLSLSVAIASNFTHDGFRSSRKVAAAYQIIFGGRQGALDFIHPEWPRLPVVSKGD